MDIKSPFASYDDDTIIVLSKLLLKLIHSFHSFKQNVIAP